VRAAIVDSNSASGSGWSTIEDERAALITSSRALGMVAASRPPSPGIKARRIAALRIEAADELDGLSD
jgi:hypothetical protein